MVPKDFTAFFQAGAGVAGALIGLLFVAISVAPDKMSTPGENTDHQIKAAAAFSSLANALIISMFALIPDGGIGESAFFMSCFGLISSAGLTVFFLRNRTTGEPVRIGQVSLLASTFALYLLQLLNGIHLWHRPHDLGAITNQAYIVVVFFIIAIARAWDLVGAQNTSLWSGVRGIAHDARADDADIR